MTTLTPHETTLTKEKVLEARDLVLSGWTKFTREDDYGNRCILGALDVALDGRVGGFADRRYTVVADVAEKLYPERAKVSEFDKKWNPVGAVLVEFNNHAETTQEDVVRVLEVTADRIAA